MLRRVLLLGLLITVFVAVSPLIASDIVKTFEVSNGGLLTITAERGSIEVTSGGRWTVD